MFLSQDNNVDTIAKVMQTYLCSLCGGREVRILIIVVDNTDGEGGCGGLLREACHTTKEEQITNSCIHYQLTRKKTDLELNIKIYHSCHLNPTL